MRRLIPALAVTLLAGPAFAAQPNLIPAHDVSGTYLITGTGGTHLVSVEYSKAANTLRINPQSNAGYILYDFTARDAKMVLPQMRSYMDNPEVARRAEALQDKAENGAAGIVKTGTETIAGHECTDYTATDKSRGTSSTICVTSDGVLLKIAGNDGSAVAQSVSYATVPQADVTLPPGYTQFTMPQLPAGMGNMGAAGGLGGMAMPGATPGTPAQ